MSTVEVPRPPRAVPRMPGGELALEPPPEPERPVPPALLARLLPGGDAAGLGRVRRPGSARPVVVAVRRHVRAVDGRDAARRRRGPQRGPAAGGASTRSGATTCATWRRRGAGCGPSPPSSGRPWSTCTPIPQPGPRCSPPGRLWERRSTDPDFGLLRAGTGAQRLATTLVAPQTGPVEGLEPVTALALRRFLRAHAVVPDLPVALSLRGTARDLARGRAGRRARARPRAGPRARRAVRAVAQPGRRAARRGRHRRTWRRSGSGSSGCRTPPTRGTATPSGRCGWSRREADDVRRWWEAELAGRAPGAGADEPHLLVVVDEAAGPGSWAAVAGTTVLRVGAPPGRRPTPAVVRLLVGPVELSWTDRAASVVRRRPAGRLSGRGGHGAGPPARPLPARRCRSPRPVRPPRRACPSCSGWPRSVRAGGDQRAEPSTRCACAAAAPRTGCACRSGSTRPGRRWRWTSRSPPRAAAGRTASASAPPVRARASCCGRWSWAWSPRTRRPS